MKVRNEQTMWCGPNDGGIRRGDRADTGDEEAGPTDGSSREGSGADSAGSGAMTGDASSLGADDRVSSGSAYSIYDSFSSPDEEPTSGANIDDLTVRDADDPSLGLTDLDGESPEDWAADTGPTRTAEEFEKGEGRP